MKLTQEQIEKLAKEHMDHFERLIESGEHGNPNVRVEECRLYLQIWMETYRRNAKGNALTPEGQREIDDAVLSGDFDDMLGIEPEPNPEGL